MRGRYLRLSALLSCIWLIWGGRYLIGTNQNSGAYEIFNHTITETFDLRSGCFEGKLCPSVLIFHGNITGTMNFVNCEAGTLYTIVNRSVEEESGVLQLQNDGGSHGTQAIPRFGLGQCFCYSDAMLHCGSSFA